MPGEACRRSHRRDLVPVERGDAGRRPSRPRPCSGLRPPRRRRACAGDRAAALADRGAQPRPRAGRTEPGHGHRPRRHHPRGGVAVSRGHRRRERLGQRARGARDSRAWRAPRQTVLRDQLCRARGRSRRSRALRPYARRLYRRRQRAGRTLRGRERRHVVSRRGGRARPARASQAAADAAGRRDPTPRRIHRPARRRARRRRDQPTAGPRGRGRAAFARTSGIASM